MRGGTGEDGMDVKAHLLRPCDTAIEEAVANRERKRMAMKSRRSLDD